MVVPDYTWYSAGTVQWGASNAADGMFSSADRHCQSHPARDPQQAPARDISRTRIKVANNN